MVRDKSDYARYLTGKKIIDDVSLNSSVWTAMCSWLKSRRDEVTPVHILETGAGIGTMIERLLDAGLPGQYIYTTVELEPGFQKVACARLQAWSQSHDYNFFTKNNQVFLLENNLNKIEINWITGDIVKIMDEFTPGSFDLIIGHAVIDLLPVPLCLAGLLECIDSEGAFYFSLNYAGETVFQPSHPDDGAIFRAYHDDMDRRFPRTGWRASQTGRRLGQWLVEHGHQVVAEGPSDWHLRSRPDQAVTTNLFIADILDTIEDALAGFTGLTEWLITRRRQLETGELQFRAANRDYFGLIGKPYMGTRC